MVTTCFVFLVPPNVTAIWARRGIRPLWAVSALADVATVAAVAG